MSQENEKQEEMPKTVTLWGHECTKVEYGAWSAEVEKEFRNETLIPSDEERQQRRRILLKPHRLIELDANTDSLAAAALPDRWEVRNFQDAMKGSGVQPPWIIEDLLLGDSATLVGRSLH